MNIFLIISSLIFLLISCQSETQIKLNKTQSEEPKVLLSDEDLEDKKIKEIIFLPVLDAKQRKNRKELRKLFLDYYTLEIEPEMIFRIAYPKKIYGTGDTLYVIEAHIPEDVSCKPFGRKTQFIFNPEGKLIHIDHAAFFKWVAYGNDKTPMLMTLNTDCKGKGKHHFYKFEQGRLIDVFNVLLDETPITYDANMDDDLSSFEPNELELKMEDRNEDGKKDLVFSGKQKIKNKLETNKKNIEYVFLYKPGEDWFLQKFNTRN